MHCWKILKDQPKWLERRKHMNALKPLAKKQKTTARLPLRHLLLLLVMVVQERPLGEKKEKQMLHQCVGMEAMEYLMAKKEKADAAKELKKEERFKKAFEKGNGRREDHEH
jgi:hypothetical protein